MHGSKQLGESLREQRLKQGITLEDVYRQVRIHPRVVEDLEKGSFEKHNKIYVKSFIKKYSEFLGMDTEEVMKKYEEIGKELDVQEVELPEEKEKTFSRKTKQKKSVFSDWSLGDLVGGEKMQGFAAVILSVVFVALLFVLIATLREGPRIPEEAPRAGRAIMSPQEERAPRTERARRTEEPARRDAEDGVFTLKLEATERVWLQVSEGDIDGNVIFVGFLAEGNSVNWDLSGPVNIWTGKAEALEFSFDSRKVGKVAEGVVRGIKVSSQGIKVGDLTVFSP